MVLCHLWHSPAYFIHKCICCTCWLTALASIVVMLSVWWTTCSSIFSHLVYTALSDLQYDHWREKKRNIVCITGKILNMRTKKYVGKAQQHHLLVQGGLRLSLQVLWNSTSGTQTQSSRSTASYSVLSGRHCFHQWFQGGNTFSAW